MATIEINGQTFEAEPGKMLIEVADEQGIPIPRFCYHKYLSVAANCRMCLVEIEKSNKPMPACATPVMDGMKVFTKSPRAIAAQKNVMEFLLINHPLDCPICDQGGECELQDVSILYGQDSSKYSEAKRSVKDEDLGSLIATEMTRCIHCTRCVRFGEEISGLRELGGTGRGETMRIGTYVIHAMRSEVSGNIIDLCPVGALTSKPYRFSARPWELQQHALFAPHDCLGSHVTVHTRRQKVMRVVPKTCSEINQTWLSDRDRFSYTGLYTDRLEKPMIKKSGIWEVVDWETALITAIDKMKAVLGANGLNEWAGLSSSYATTESLYLMQKFLRALGIPHLDHRVAQQDFRDDAHLSLYPGTVGSYADFSKAKSVLLVGSDICREQPLAGIRLREASKAGARLVSINAFALQSALPLEHQWVVHPKLFTKILAAILKAVGELKKYPLSKSWKDLLSKTTIDHSAQSIAAMLCEDRSALIVLGIMVEAHQHAAEIRSLTRKISEITGAHFAIMTQGPNQAGAALAGVLPHRGPGGKMFAESESGDCLMHHSKKGYLLLHLEPEYDCIDSGKLLENLFAAEAVVTITAFDSPQLRSYSDVILPAAAFSEMPGTFVNFEGKWQTWRAATTPVGEARPAWKILRVLGNLLELDGFDFCTSQAVLDELKKCCDENNFVEPELWVPESLDNKTDQVTRVGGWAMYASDPLQRRALPLQKAASNDPSGILVSPNVAKRYNLRHTKEACVLQNSVEVSLTVWVDETLPENCVYLPAGFEGSVGLGALCAEIDLK